jgi:BD-FAE
MRAVVFAILPYLWWPNLPVPPVVRKPDARIRLDHGRGDAIYEARLKWAREAVIAPPLGIYHDYRVILDVHAATGKDGARIRQQVVKAAIDAGVDAVMWTGPAAMKSAAWTGYQNGILFLRGPDDTAKPAAAPPDEARKWRRVGRKAHPDEALAALAGPLHFAGPDGGVAQAAKYAHHVQALRSVPYGVSFRDVSTHILALHLTPVDLEESLRAGRVYVAHDWLCDPRGFSMAAINGLGVYEIGDRVPLVGKAGLVARFPVAAHIELLRNGTLVASVDGGRIARYIQQPGAYRLRVSLTAGGQQLLWIYTDPIYFEKPAAGDVPQLPPAGIAPEVRVIRNIAYAAIGSAQEKERRLDLYLPRKIQHFPVFLFVHGALFQDEDRARYAFLGNCLAQAGIGVAIPDYRTAPGADYATRADDVAAAAAWTWRHIGDYGGDARRMDIGGYSAGAQLAALVALNSAYLKKQGLVPQIIHGVVGISGVYDLPRTQKPGPAASPSTYINSNAPAFLIAYSQWDELGHPAQARLFDAQLRKSFITSTLLFLPRENHFSEMTDIARPGDPLARAVVRFIRSR